MRFAFRSEEHTSELQSQSNLVCRLLLEKKIKRGELLFQLGTPARELLALLAHAPEAHRHRALSRTARLDPHLQLARRRLWRLRLGARSAWSRSSLRRTAGRGSAPRLTRSQSRPTHSPSRVPRELPAVSAARARNASPSDSAFATSSFFSLTGAPPVPSASPVASRSP